MKKEKKNHVPEKKQEVKPAPAKPAPQYAVAKDVKVEEFSGQQLVILKAMGHEPLTAEQIAARAAKHLETRQEPIRVVAYYLNEWRHKGIVKEAK